MRLRFPILPQLDITRLPDQLHGHARHGALVPITWHNIPAWHIEQLLRRYHITLYGRSLRIERHGNIETWIRTAYVNHKQAAWAEYILLRAGVALTSPTIDPRNAARAARHTAPPPSWSGNRPAAPATFLEALGDLLAFLTGFEPMY
jgi:hypothetical protein